MNLAIITVIGQCVGARDEGQIRYYLKKLLLITYLAEGALISTILLSLDWILRLYGLGPETTALAKKLVMIHNGSAMLLWPVAFVLPNMLRACNDVRYTMLVSICSMFCFRVMFGYILGARMGMGAVGVWIAMDLDWICRTAFFVGRYISGRWKKLAGLS